MTTFTPMPHQDKGISLLMACDEQMLLWPTGSGKTATVEEAFSRLRDGHRAGKEWGCDKLLVVAGELGKTAWEEDRNKFFPHLRFSDMNKRNFDPSADGWLINWHTLEGEAPGIREIMRGRNVVLCGDEIHRAKNLYTNRTQAFASLSRQASRTWGLTATPFDRREQFYGLLKLFKATNLSESAFRDRYCISRTVRTPNGKISKVAGYKDDNGWQRLMNSKASRFYPEYLKEIPVRVIRVPVTMPPVQAALYREAARGFLYGIGDWRQFSDAEVVHAFRSRMETNHRLLQIATHPRIVEEYSACPAPSAKYDALVKFVDAFLEENPGEGVLVWYYFQGNRPLLEEALSEWNPLFLGHTESHAQREKNFYAFKQGKSRVLCASFGVASESINLQSCATAVFLELVWPLTMYDQAIGRLRRTGQTKPVTLYFLVSEGTTDEEMYQGVAQKHTDSEIYLDGKDIRLLIHAMESVVRVAA